MFKTTLLFTLYQCHTWTLVQLMGLLTCPNVLLHTCSNWIRHLTSMLAHVLECSPDQNNICTGWISGMCVSLDQREMWRMFWRLSGSCRGCMYIAGSCLCHFPGGQLWDKFAMTYDIKGVYQHKATPLSTQLKPITKTLYFLCFHVFNVAVWYNYKDHLI